MTDVLTGSVVTITYTDDSVGVVVIATSPEDTRERLNRSLVSGDEPPPYLTFEAVDTNKVLWFNRELIAAIEVEPQTLADATETVAKEVRS